MVDGSRFFPVRNLPRLPANRPCQQRELEQHGTSTRCRNRHLQHDRLRRHRFHDRLVRRKESSAAAAHAGTFFFRWLYLYIVVISVCVDWCIEKSSSSSIAFYKSRTGIAHSHHTNIHPSTSLNPKSLIQPMFTWRHFGSDELFGMWMFFVGTG